MRGSVRRRSLGSWEPTVDLGRHVERGWVRQYRTARGTEAEARRVLNGMLRAVEMGVKELSPGLLLGIFMERWLEERVYPRLRSQTCVLYAREVRMRMRMRLGPELGNILLHRLTTRDVSEMEYR